MSLMSYRAAPPRDNRRKSRIVVFIIRYIVCRTGNDLLSQVLRHSTIGAAALNGRVRNGIGFYHCARATSPANNASKLIDRCVMTRISNESDQANRTISTGKLNPLLSLHTRPINVVVFHGSQGSARFEVGFPLRCIQRLSRPYIATLHCRWRDNRSTRDTSTPVLSY
jgi:hypothetical protein